MVEQQLDPSIIAFKEFINKHPQICEDIHLKKVSIQSLYEKWVTLGEEDPFWKNYQHTRSQPTSTDAQEQDRSQTGDLVQTIMSAAKNMDMAKIETYVEQVSSAVSSVQEIVQQFNKQKNPPSSPQSNPHQQGEFFRWMRD